MLRPDGQPGIYGVVETPVATGVVALTDADEVVLVGQWRYALHGWSWEIIEGGSEPGEPPLEAARRELREEGGLVAAHWSPLGGEVHLSNSFTDERAHVFLATELSEVEAEPDATEVLELRREPLPACLEMVDSGEITDAMTIIALLRLDRMRRAGR